MAVETPDPPYAREPSRSSPAIDPPAGRIVNDLPDQADRGRADALVTSIKQAAAGTREERGAVMGAAVVLSVGIEPSSVLEQLQRHVKAEDRVR